MLKEFLELSLVTKNVKSRSKIAPFFQMSDILKFDFQKKKKKRGGEVYFRSQILERPSIGEYWNIFGVPVLLENVIFTFFRTCWCYSEAYDTGT